MNAQTTDRFDSRDLIEELAELEAMEAADRDQEDIDRMAAIRELADSGIEDWEFGAQFIPESEFEDYAQELAEDIGAIPDDNQWPLYCIDWERAARELSTDYSLVEFEGDSYYVR